MHTPAPDAPSPIPAAPDAVAPDAAGPDWLSRGRVPSLDGLRGVSVGVVLLAHSAGALGAHEPGWVYQLWSLGGVGVDVFFVISGFLITLLLVRERARTGRVSLRGFYARRAVRILPASLAYLAVIGAWLAVTGSPLRVGDWARVLSYTVSLSPRAVPWDVSHFWTLSVEEHFYLAWPVLFAWLPDRWLLRVSAGYVAAAVPLRWVLLRHAVSRHLPVGADVHHLLHHFSPTRADAIAVGCAMALLARSTAVRRFAAGPRAAAVLGVGGVVGLACSVGIYIHANHAPPPGRWTARYNDLGYELVNELCIAAVVWAAVFHPGAGPARWLNRRPLVAVGVLSYSLYLWQQPFFRPPLGGWATALPLHLLAVAGLAVASYVGVERPCLRLKARLESTAEGRRRGLAEARRSTDPLPAT